jgi:hypothetical protein
MILLTRFEPSVQLVSADFKVLRQYDELVKIYDFVELPDSIKKIERLNSKILRNYYANALDHNLLDIKTVKYIVSGNIRPKGLAERSIEQYNKAEEWLSQQVNETIGISTLYHLQKLLILDLYNHHTENNLFNQTRMRSAEKINALTEHDLEQFFEFLNTDQEWHPVVQAMLLHHKIMHAKLFSEANSKIAQLLCNYWLEKKGYNMDGLLSIEHEWYICKNDYYSVFSDENNEQRSIEVGIQVFGEHLKRVKLLLRTYFRKQVDFEKHNPRLKNIMNYVFERGFRLKEIDDKVLNNRQKLMMYIIQHKGFIATKELINEFNCNRKTIQRDFSALIEHNLVKTVGQGAGLKYAVNIEENKHNDLKAYQADFLKESTSLWD